MSNNDNIEGTFRDNFNTDNLSNEGWNVPSDMVWDRIENDLGKRDKPLLRYLLPILASGLFFLFGGMGYLMYQNNNLANHVNDVLFELENCGNQSSDKQNINPPNVQSHSKEIIISLDEISKSKIVEIGSTQFEDTELEKYIEPINVAEKLNSKQRYINQSSEIVPDGIFKNLINDNGVSKIDEFSKGYKWITINKKRHLYFLEKLPQKESYLISGTSYMPFLQPDIIFSIADIPPDFFVSISAGIIGSSLISKGSQMTALTELIDREYAKLGSIIDVKYTSMISGKWSASGGIGLSRQQFITEYDITLPYKIGEEIRENGIGHIDFEHSLPTSFGCTDTELRLRRSNTDLPLEEENVNIDFDTKHRFLSLLAPISIDYIVLELNSGFNIGLDFIPSYIISANSGISSVVSQHSRIESVNNDSSSNYSELQKINLALGGHVGYRYPITKSSGLEFNAKYTRNLKSYFSSDSFSSQSSGVQLSAGYFFRF